MRKLYALLGGLFIALTAINAKLPSPDLANFTFTINHPGNDVTFTNTSALGSEPGIRKAFWSFGDGSGQVTPPLAGTQHHYASSGTYNVCLRIYRYRPNANDSVLSAQICKSIVIQTVCGADFERLPNTSPNSLQALFKALPFHNANKKPVRICWQFGDGRDTCIQYSNTNPGPYLINHIYNQPGVYEVCVKILYQEGCEARKCRPVEMIRPDTCAANFERLPITPNNNPLFAYFKALPSHNNNRKPSKVCWAFGDGRDTCINYTETYTGLYATGHQYSQPGLYTVCVKINYFGGCEARKCEPVRIERPDSCRADFERIPVTAATPLIVGFRALPWHNNDKKPQQICWRFGDGSDTCINYPAAYTGAYTVAHRYAQPGQYEVCVKITYYGGCEAYKCKPVAVPPPVVTCTVRLFEIIPSVTSLVRGFYAIPSSVPTRRPVRVCWEFGDGSDTCWIINPAQPLPIFLIRHTYPAPGVYRACVKVLFDGGCMATECKEVVIRPVSNICGGYMTDSLVAPRVIKFKGFGIHNPNDEVATYRWTFGDASTALGREVTHTYNQGGTYEVCLTIITRLGCETRICKRVSVPGNNQPALVLSPNPVHTILTAAYLSTHTETVTIKILNGNGVPVRTYSRNATVGPNTWTFDLSTLIPGVYSMVVQSPNQLASAIFIKI